MLRLARKTAPAGSPLAKLPAELVLGIADHLNGYERSLLSQTCRRFRSLLSQYRLHIQHPISENDYLQYITLLARDRLDIWVCKDCSCLHRVNEQDVQGGYQFQRYELYGPKHNNIKNRINGFYDPYTHTGWNHVQLALKYRRLYGSCSSTQRAYLAKLVRPYNSERCEADEEVRKSIWFEKIFHPKVVCHNGRLLYLLHGETDYETGEGVDSTSRLARTIMHVCRHQSFLARPSTAYSFAAAYEAMGDLRRNGRMGTRDVSCPSCLTDVTFTFTPTRVSVATWTCLGAESPEDWMWEYHTGAVGRIDRREYPSGWVRDLFEREEKSSAICWR